MRFFFSLVRTSLKINSNLTPLKTIFCSNLMLLPFESFHRIKCLALWKNQPTYSQLDLHHYHKFCWYQCCLEDKLEGNRKVRFCGLHAKSSYRSRAGRHFMEHVNMWFGQVLGWLAILKKNLGPITSNFWVCFFFMFSGSKKFFFKYCSVRLHNISYIYIP